MANFLPLNRYTGGIITFTRNNQQFLVLRNPLNLIPDSSDTYVTLNSSLASRPDLISYNAYSRPDLWWAILEYNNISDPITQLKVGSILVIPDLDRLIDAINLLGSV